MNSSIRNIFHNFTALSIVQLANYVFPLITVPYLARILGAEKFGLIAFAQSFALFFIMISKYGFDLSATRQIAIDRENLKKVGKIYSEVMAVKTLLIMIALAFFSIIVAVVPRFREEAVLFYLSFCAILGGALFPIWFFQGIEKMKPMAVLNLVSPAVFTLGIFVFVVDRDDYWKVPLLNAVGLLCSGLLAQAYVYRYFGIPIHVPKWDALQKQLVSGWHFFISSLALNLYSGANTFFLGLLTNNTSVGYFSAAEKIISAICGLLTPIFQAVYPQLSKMATENYRQAHRLFLYFQRRIILVTSIGSVGVALTSKWIILFLMGEGFEESVIVLRILALFPVLVGIATSYTNLYLVGFGYSRVWSRIILITSFTSLAGIWFFVAVLGLDHMGVAVNMLITECVVITLSYRKYLKLDRERSAAEGQICFH